MVVYAIAVDEKNIYVLSDLYKIVEKKIEIGTCLNGTMKNLGPFDIML